MVIVLLLSTLVVYIEGKMWTGSTHILSGTTSNSRISDIASNSQISDVARQDSRSTHLAKFLLGAIQISPCNHRNEFAPCSCRVTLTNFVLHRQGREINAEYPESVCDLNENARREEKGWISPMYACTQLRSKVTLYRDAADRPIEEEINYDAGCELRIKTPTATPTATVAATEKNAFLSSWNNSHMAHPVDNFFASSGNFSPKFIARFIAWFRLYVRDIK